MIVKNKLLNYSNAYIYQDTEYFKMSLDSLLLAKFVTINMRDKNIIDLATGNAPIPMLLTYRTKAHICGVEIQEEVYNLANLSIKKNKMTQQISLINEDVNNITDYFKPDTFDVVTCNPPYFKTNNTLFENNNIIKASARHEKLLTLEDILRVSNGRLAMVHRTERLMEILFLMKKYNIEPKKIRFVYPNNAKNSDLVLIEGTLNGKSGLKIMNPLFVYVKKDVYSKEVKDMFGEWNLWYKIVIMIVPLYIWYLLLLEDTRVTLNLLTHYGINKKLIALHEHNEDTAKEKVLDYLKNGDSVALVTDRGTPIISDPGYKTVKYISDNGYNVVALPGATAFVPALITSGIAPQPFLFYGFLDSKDSIRKKELELLSDEVETMIFYEAPHRIIKTLNMMLDIFGDRDISISREITKKFETIYRGKISNVINLVPEKGEFVIVVNGMKERKIDDTISVHNAVNNYISAGFDVMASIKKVAKDRGLAKNVIYKEYHREDK